MTTAAMTVTPIAWWKEPTKDQWYAYSGLGQVEPIAP